MKLEFSVYRYNPDVDDAPRMQDYTGSGRGSRHDAAGRVNPAERKTRRCRSAAPAVKGFVAPTV